MSSRRKQEVDLREELGRVFIWDGDPEDAYASLQRFPGAEHTPGELAILGACLEIAGKRVSDAAKDLAEARGINPNEPDHGVYFTRREPTFQTRVDTDWLKANGFTPEAYPAMYKQSSVKGSIVPDLPFKK